MPYIYLIIRHITKQKRNKKQHFVAPKFAQNQNFVFLVIAFVIVEKLTFHSLQVSLQQGTARGIAEAAEGFLLDLAYALTGEAKVVAYLLERHLLTTDAEEHLQYLLLAFAERGEGAVDLRGERLVHERLVGCGRVATGEHIEQTV